MQIALWLILSLMLYWYHTQSLASCNIPISDSAKMPYYIQPMLLEKGQLMKTLLFF